MVPPRGYCCEAECCLEWLGAGAAGDGCWRCMHRFSARVRGVACALREKMVSQTRAAPKTGLAKVANTAKVANFSRLDLVSRYLGKMNVNFLNFLMAPAVAFLKFYNDVSQGIDVRFSRYRRVFSENVFSIKFARF